MISLILECLMQSVSLQASTNPLVREGNAVIQAFAGPGQAGRRTSFDVRCVNSWGVRRNYKITEMKAAATK